MGTASEAQHQERQQQQLDLQPLISMQQQQHSTTKRTVICLGDSHTRGWLGASWVGLLALRLPQLQFINAGRDGEPSERILGRLPGLLRAHPDPAAVLLLSGSNDCIAQETAGLQQYYRWCKWLTQPCSEQHALSNADRMLHMLREQAPNAKVGDGRVADSHHCAVYHQTRRHASATWPSSCHTCTHAHLSSCCDHNCTTHRNAPMQVIVINLPILVEDPRHAANIRAHKYSRALGELVTRQHPWANVVDFQSACRAHMATNSAHWKQAVKEMRQLQENSNSSSLSGAAPAGPSSSSQWALSFWSLARNGVAAKCQHLIYGRSWNEVSRLQGLLLLTDQVHMNETAAWLLAGLVQPLLQGA